MRAHAPPRGQRSWAWGGGRPTTRVPSASGANWTVTSVGCSSVGARVEVEAQTARAAPTRGREPSSTSWPSHARSEKRPAARSRIVARGSGVCRTASGHHSEARSVKRRNAADGVQVRKADFSITRGQAPADVRAPCPRTRRGSHAPTRIPVGGRCRRHGRRPSGARRVPRPPGREDGARSPGD